MKSKRSTNGCQPQNAERTHTTNDDYFVKSAPARASTLARSADGSNLVTGCFGMKRTVCQFAMGLALKPQWLDLIGRLSHFVGKLTASVVRLSETLVLFLGTSANPTKHNLASVALFGSARYRPQCQMLVLCTVKNGVKWCDTATVFPAPVGFPVIFRLTVRKSPFSDNFESLNIATNEDHILRLTGNVGYTWQIFKLDWELCPGDDLLDMRIDGIGEELLARPPPGPRAVFRAPELDPAVDPFAHGAEEAAARAPFGSYLRQVDRSEREPDEVDAADVPTEIVEQLGEEAEVEIDEGAGGADVVADLLFEDLREALFGEELFADGEGVVDPEIPEAEASDVDQEVAAKLHVDAGGHGGDEQRDVLPSP